MSGQQHKQPKDWRNQEFKYNPFFFQITFGVIAIVVAVLIGFALFPDDMGYRSNLYTTAVGALITIAFLDLLARRREDKRFKAQLIREMGNADNGIATRAVEELRANNWGFDEDRSLRHAYLLAANLQNADLAGIDLTSATLGFAKLQGASLANANLQGADLQSVKLTTATLVYSNFQNTSLKSAALMGAHMANIDLRGADLSTANLEGAILWTADLRGAKLWEANLQGVEFRCDFDDDMLPAKFDETTILPDKTYWTPDTDMRRFTDPEHNKFWKARYARKSTSRKQNE